MAKKQVKTKKNLDSYLYTNPGNIKTTKDWIAFLKKFDSDTPDMKDKLREEKEVRKDETFYKGYGKSITEGNKRDTIETLHHNLTVFKKMFLSKFRPEPFLVNLVDSLEVEIMTKTKGVIGAVTKGTS